MYRLSPYCAPEFAPLVSGTWNVPPALAAVLPPPSDPWSISPQLGTLLFRLVTEYSASHVLEFGAGSSSVVLAAALAEHGGGQLTSIEEDPRWCAKCWEQVGHAARVDAELVGARPKLTWGLPGPYYAYRDAGTRIAARGPYDLIPIDAPQYYYGRDGALHIAHEQMAVGALIVLDDAGRSSERWSVRRWLRTYRGLELRLYDPSFGGKGVAILEVTTLLEPHFDAVTIASGAYYALEYWSKRRKRRRRRAKAEKQATTNMHEAK